LLVYNKRKGVCKEKTQQNVFFEIEDTICCAFNWVFFCRAGLQPCVKPNARRKAQCKAKALPYMQKVNTSLVAALPHWK